MSTQDDRLPISSDWPAVRAWRNERRQELVAKRTHVTLDDRRAAQKSLIANIRAAFPELFGEAVGFYWPIKGEIDLRPLLIELLAEGADAALPVVVEKQAPVEFWYWHKDTPMSRGTGNIPVPRDRNPVQPSVLLIPLLGFDVAGHRLGYGGGYYDRTLASFRLMPKTIGVGYEFGRLPTIYPQPHDIPLSAIVTESGVMRFDREAGHSVDVSSSPCYLDESDLR